MSLLHSETQLVNGAWLRPISRRCDVCIKINQEPEPSTFSVSYKGQEIYLCNAHTHKLLDMNEDQAKGDKDFYELVFGKQ